MCPPTWKAEWWDSTRSGTDVTRRARTESVGVSRARVEALPAARNASLELVPVTELVALVDGGTAALAVVLVTCACDLAASVGSA